MRYYLNINQLKAIEWELSLSEAIMFDYLSYIVGQNKIEAKTIDGHIYWWVAKTKAIEDLPILTDKPDTIYKLYKSLDHKEIISYVKSGSKDFIRMTEKADDWHTQNYKNNSEKNPSSENNSEKNPSELGKKSEKEIKNSEKNPTDNKILLLGKEGSESSSNSFSLPVNSNLVGTKQDTPSPSNTPLPPDVKNLGIKMCNLFRSKMRSEMDDILSRTDLDLPTLSEMFAEYWTYNKQRTFDPKNWKGVVSSFIQWSNVGMEKELPQKEVSIGIKGRGVMEEIIEIVRKKKGIEMTSDEATAVKKFLSETILTDEQLKMEVTRRFLMGGGTTWKTWLSIAGNVHSEEMYHRRLNGKVLV